jgi:enoyl-CoA hydratase/carnithine racemase
MPSVSAASWRVGDCANTRTIGATNTSLAEQMELETEWLTDVAATADVQEGIAAFLAKRPAQFAGG